MKKIAATIKKEWILLRRDISGMLLLLLMPAVLIIVMALVQDAPFKSYKDLRFDLLVADNDNGTLSRDIIKGLKQSKNFHVVDSVNDEELSSNKLKQLLLKGEYKIGIVIPKGATAEIVNLNNIIANDISEKIGLGNTLPVRNTRDSMYIKIYFDPVTQPTFRTMIHAGLDKYITYASTNMLVTRLSQLGRAGNDTSQANTKNLKKVFTGLGIQEEAVNDNGREVLHINSVQHNVPAWAIFGMFFIVVPLASHLLREREEGSALRLSLIPNSQTSLALGRIIFYTIVCTVQFIIMFCIGLWLMPIFGLPALTLGMHPWVLLPIAICISFAATSFGTFIGSVFKSSNQALPFGSIAIVILSAIGGIWIPVEILPETMQRLANVSPLRWGLAAINEIILRDGNFAAVIKYLAALLSFGIVLWLISVYRNKMRNQSLQ